MTGALNLFVKTQIPDEKAKPYNMKKLLLLFIVACSPLLSASPVCAQDVQAFIWDSTNGMRALGSLGGDSYATGINDSGQVVGYSYLSDQFTSHSFIWTEATGMVDIGGPGGLSRLRWRLTPWVTSVASARIPRTDRWHFLDAWRWLQRLQSRGACCD
jgi:probable HAF family extracellular repeat protein